MNIQTRKLVLIEEFLRISDEKIIEKLESLIRHEKKNLHDREQQPMSIKTFHEMIDKAKNDSETGKVISQQDLKKKIKSWK